MLSPGTPTKLCLLGEISHNKFQIGVTVCLYLLGILDTVQLRGHIQLYFFLSGQKQYDSAIITFDLKLFLVVVENICDENDYICFRNQLWWENITISR